MALIPEVVGRGDGRPEVVEDEPEIVRDFNLIVEAVVESWLDGGNGPAYSQGASSYYNSDDEPDLQPVDTPTFDMIGRIIRQSLNLPSRVLLGRMFSEPELHKIVKAARQAGEANAFAAGWRDAWQRDREEQAARREAEALARRAEILRRERENRLRREAQTLAEREELLREEAHIREVKRLWAAAQAAGGIPCHVEVPPRSTGPVAEVAGRMADKVARASRARLG